MTDAATEAGVTTMTEATTKPKTATTVEPVAIAPTPDGTSRTPRVLRQGVPARMRIMGWLILLMAVVLLSVAIVTRSLLLQRVETTVNTALEQETREFSGVAASGVDRATGEPFRNVRELLRNHLQRQFPDDDEVLVGAVRTGTGRSAEWEILRQDRHAPLALHERRQVLDPILASPDGNGRVDTDAGEMGWAKVTVTSQTEPGTAGTFVVGYLIDRDRAEVDDTIRILALVSLLGLALTGVASWLIAGRILAPVRLVNTTAAQITEQDLTRRIPVEGNDEFAALAAQFNAMLDRLEHEFATQREFLDDASHELRTPITIVRGHLELLEPHTSDPDERLAVTRICLDELDRMTRMVDDLLLLARVEQPDFLHLQPVDLVELTSDIEAKIQVLADRRWRLEAIGEGIVTVDPQRITQAVVQLAHNAVQHTDDGAEILFGSALDGGRASFWITDHGTGVSPDDAKVIFERFARGAATKPGSRGGAGLGLAIVRAIADAHGGEVKLISTPGAGATFGLDLPADPAATPSRTKP